MATIFRKFLNEFYLLYLKELTDKLFPSHEYQVNQYL